MHIDIKTACERLLQNDDILIYAHQKPDGDTLGASFALLWALERLGKRARVECVDGFPERYSFVYGDYSPNMSFEARYFVSVDIASASLIDSKSDQYNDKIDLCIDHHKSNTLYAKETLLDTEAPAVCQVIFEIIRELGVAIDKHIATALFTGISTDTGCFKYSSVTAKTHRTAADLIELGADHGRINKLMFDTKTRGMLMVDRLMIETTTFYCADRCALAVIPADVSEKYGVSEEELDGISSFTVRIDGVYAGVTVRVKADDTYRVSLRTVSPIDASKICANFGGGGHMNAAGCTLTGNLYDAINSIIASVEEELVRNELI